jgi:hypothetical protein
MSTPGFTAENSLVSAGSSYRQTSLATPMDDLIEPQIFGVIKEIFQKAAKGLSDPIKDAASAIGKELNNLRPHGPNDPPFYCQSWAQPALACNGRGPMYSAIEITQKCIGVNPASSIFCASSANALHRLVIQACADNPEAVQELLPRFCQGS